MPMNNQMLSMLQQFKSNPAQFLMQRKFNIPANMMSDPNAIVNYLLSTNQVSQAQVNQAYQAAQRFK